MGQRLNKNQKLNILSSGFRGLLAIVFIVVLLLPCLVIEGKTSPIQTSGPGSFSRLVKQASPSVVNISAVSRRTLMNILIGWFLTPAIACSIAVALYFMVHLKYAPG